MLARLKEIMFAPPTHCTLYWYKLTCKIAKHCTITQDMIQKCRSTMAHATIYYDNNACPITEQILEGAPPVHTEDRGMEIFHSAG